MLKKNKYFFTCFFIYLLAGLGLLLFFDKGKVEVFINQFHISVLDYFFQYITHLGDGLFAVVFILAITLFWKVYYGILAAVCFAVSTLVVQGLKRLVFEETLRPSKFFEGTLDLYYIEGLEIHSNFSFPSGHASGAFTLFAVLAFVSGRPVIQVVCFVIAFLVGFSRMYLLQHFFIDTYFGALLGVLFTVLSYIYVENNTNLGESLRLKQPLIKMSR